MPKAITKEIFVEKAKKINNNAENYGYALVEYVNYQTPVKIVCKTHGVFEQKPNNHLAGAACPICASKIRKEKAPASVKRTKDSVDDFIKKAVSLYGERYDYSKVIYTNSRTPVEIVCKEHGSFLKAPSVHINNKIGCPRCSGIEVSSFEDFIAKAKEIHGDLYDYSLVKYKNTKTKIELICKKHGLFTQSPHTHLQGHGCYRCGQSVAANASGDLSRMTKEEFLLRAGETHGTKYKYNLANWEGSKGKIKITCEKHGDFFMKPSHHVNSNQGCPKCGEEKTGEKNRISPSELLSRFRKAHKSKYKYDISNHTGQRSKINAKCEKHGWFSQSAGSHMRGNGCPRCVVRISKPEQELYDWLLTYQPDAEQSNRTLIKPKEIDIVVPSKNIAIEFNGIRYHSDRFEGKQDNYHLEKTLACEAQNYKLIHVWEDDWRDRKEVVKKTILHALGLTESKRQARKCTLKEITPTEAKSFFIENHLQGYTGAKTCFALFDGEKIVAAMMFSYQVSSRGSKSNDKDWELVRFANDGIVAGAASRLFKAFLKTYNPGAVTSYSARDAFGGGMYEMLGFKVLHHVRPDYKVVDGETRRHKSAYRLEKLRARFGTEFDESLGERENCRNNGLFRIYDCGLTKWVFVLDITNRLI